MGRNTTSYRYAADGRKLRATYKTFPGQHVGDDDRYTERNDSGLVRPGNGRIFVPSTFVETKTVDYVGNLIYEDNVIKKILIDGGYITFNEGNAPEYHFYIKDHLGNNRVVVYTSGEVEQVNHYYPYGGLMAESTNWNTQWYKYNGKELDRMHGLDWYDYGARWQDAAIGGRWHAMDPLCEKYYDVSPYVYCVNNPVMMVDPNGEEVIKGYGSDFLNQAFAALAEYLQQNDDPNSIMIIAHGVYKENENKAYAVNIKTYNEESQEWEDNIISNGEQLNNLLSEVSETWQKHNKGEIAADDLHISFYSCGAADVVKKISSDKAFENVSFIAPNRQIRVGIKTGRAGNYTFPYVSKCDVTNDGVNFGQWIKIKNGKIPFLFPSYNGKANFPGIKGFKYNNILQ